MQRMGEKLSGGRGEEKLAGKSESRGMRGVGSTMREGSIWFGVKLESW